MLAFMHAPSSSPIAYLPAQPSPLSPRSANISSRWGTSRGAVVNGPGTGDSFMSNPKTITAHDENATPFSERPIKRVPLQKQEDLKERRRTNFLRNVRDKREERRYEARGEDVMRLEFVQKKRAWEKELERGAPVDAPEEDELPMWSQGGSQMQMSSMRASSQALPEEEVEDFVRDEEGELEALLEFMPEDNTREAEQGMEVVVEEEEEEEQLWSDGADYDALFSEVLGLEENTQNQSAIATAKATAQHVQQQQHGDDDEMDMS